MAIPRMRTMLWRRKSARFGVVFGLLTAAACSCMLPPAPRLSVTMPVKQPYVVFSPALSLAVVRISGIHPREMLWDLISGRQLLELDTTNRDIAYSSAIFPDNRTIVELTDDDEVRIRDIPSGELSR